MPAVRALLALLPAVAALALPSGASAEVAWLCEPGAAAANPCRESQATTVYEAGGASRTEDVGLPADPPVDCFYVYPTVSNQPTVNATKARDPEVVSIARYQAARFSERCRVFAPLYRQTTVLSIFAGSPEARAAGAKIAYGDVREAWREYLARHNRGRGVVLLGHSQGTRMLRQLVREEIDPDPAARRRLVSALLLGGNVLVREGRRDGGDFAHVPACSRPDETGCVVAFSAFGEAPPDDTRFGRAPATDTSGVGFPAGPDFEVLCTNPMSLATNERREMTTYLRSEPYAPGLILVGLVRMFGGPPPSAPTPWLRPADRYTGKCETVNGANVLLVEPRPGARRLMASPDDTWGLHLADANLPLGELVDLVGTQTAAYLRPGAAASRRPAIRVRSAGRCRVRISLAEAKGVRRLDVRAGRRLLARDRRAPFAVTVRRARTARRLQVVTVLADGTRRTLTRRVAGC